MILLINIKILFYGFWLENNKLYIDISKHFKNRREAQQFGIKNNQKAIYNIEKDQSEYITKKAYILYKYNEKNNDLIYIYEYEKIQDLQAIFKINLQSIYNKINFSITDDIKLLNNNYCIICENIEA